jgi:hypothetical protein
MVELPSSDELPIGKLAAVFNDTTNSYKFYWFLAILEELKMKDSNQMTYDSLCSRMISNVLFPLEFYKLSFGKLDGFKTIAIHLNQLIGIDYGPNAQPVFEQINENVGIRDKRTLLKQIKVLTRWVPFRFVRPFFANEIKGLPDYKVNNSIKLMANTSHQQQPWKCPYYFDLEGIVINKDWFEYFKKHLAILQSFTYWHLVQFVQKNNPNVIGISCKLFKPTQRNLALNIKSWKYFLERHPETICIYSGNILPINFTLDHFVPWSYVVHDLSWNLIPVSKSVNSRKSNNLPNLNYYLDPFMEIQFQYCRFLIGRRGFDKLIEQYCLLFNIDFRELTSIQIEVFMKKLSGTIVPMVQIAGNSGFNLDWIFNSELIRLDKL